MSKTVEEFNHEVVKFTHKFKLDVLDEVLETLTTQITEETVLESCKNVVQTLRDDAQDALLKVENKVKKNSKKSDKPKVARKLSSYNRFIKTIMPKITSDFPDLENNKRMEKASEIWKGMSVEEKEKFKVTDEDPVESVEVEVVETQPEVVSETPSTPSTEVKKGKKPAKIVKK